MDTTTTIEPLMSARDVAGVLHVSRAFVYELAQTWQPDDLRIPSVRIGRSVRFRREDVAKYIGRHVEGKAA